MPLFRLHQGSLEESIKTTVIVRNMKELKDVIQKTYESSLGIYPENTYNFPNFDVSIFIPYEKSLEESFDPRCGWYTHMVTADLLKKGVFQPVGFLSEPLKPIVLHFKNELILTLNETPPPQKMDLKQYLLNKEAATFYQ